MSISDESYLFCPVCNDEFLFDIDCDLNTCACGFSEPASTGRTVGLYSNVVIEILKSMGFRSALYSKETISLESAIQGDALLPFMVSRAHDIANAHQLSTHFPAGLILSDSSRSLIGKRIGLPLGFTQSHLSIELLLMVEVIHENFELNKVLSPDNRNSFNFNILPNVTMDTRQIDVNLQGELMTQAILDMRGSNNHVPS
jgi:hypothetical protein